MKQTESIKSLGTTLISSKINTKSTNLLILKQENKRKDFDRNSKHLNTNELTRQHLNPKTEESIQYTVLIKMLDLNLGMLEHPHQFS